LGSYEAYLPGLRQSVSLPYERYDGPVFLRNLSVVRQIGT